MTPLSLNNLVHALPPNVLALPGQNNIVLVLLPNMPALPELNKIVLVLLANVLALPGLPPLLGQFGALTQRSFLPATWIWVLIVR